MLFWGGVFTPTIPIYCVILKNITQLIVVCPCFFEITHIEYEVLIDKRKEESACQR